jgi:hypothetical protein
VEVLNKVGVTILDESLVESIAAANSRAGAPEDSDWAAAREQALVIHFIHGTNATYKAYLTHLHNSFLDGTDYYPTTLHEAYNILQRREPKGGVTGVEDDGVAFVMADGGESGGSTGCNLNHTVCFECNQNGNYANQCPSRGQGKQQEQGTNMCTSGMEEADDGLVGFHSHNPPPKASCQAGCC